MTDRVFSLTAIVTIAWLMSLPSAFAQSASFDQLVAEAGSIALTEVLNTRSGWQQLRGRRAIVTEVELRVLQQIKGRTDSLVTLRLLGGFVGDVNQHVAGTPNFLVGDNDVLFLSAQPTLVAPLVDMPHGRFRVVSGHGGVGRFIANSALQPILTVSEYLRPQRLASEQRAVTLDEFISTIKARLPR